MINFQIAVTVSQGPLAQMFQLCVKVQTTNPMGLLLVYFLINVVNKNYFLGLAYYISSVPCLESLKPGSFERRRRGKCFHSKWGTLIISGRVDCFLKCQFSIALAVYLDGWLSMN